jgi:hypothetical protein
MLLLPLLLLPLLLLLLLLFASLLPVILFQVIRIHYRHAPLLQQLDIYRLIRPLCVRNSLLSSDATIESVLSDAAAQVVLPAEFCCCLPALVYSSAISPVLADEDIDLATTDVR